MSVSLSLKNICRRFIKDNEEFLAVNNVNLDVQPGEFLTFLARRLRAKPRRFA